MKKKSFADKYVAPILTTIFFGSMGLGIVLTLKLHLILGFIVASILGTLLFVALLAALYYLVSMIVGLSHTDTVSGSGSSEREDLRDLVFCALLYGWPLIAFTYLAIIGEAGFAFIALYLIPAYISMIYMKIWYYQDRTSKETVDQILYGDLPASSRAGRLLMALIPIMNLFIAWGAIEEWFKRK